MDNTNSSDIKFSDVMLNCLSNMNNLTTSHYLDKEIFQNLQTSSNALIKCLGKSKEGDIPNQLSTDEIEILKKFSTEEIMNEIERRNKMGIYL